MKNKIEFFSLIFLLLLTFPVFGQDPIEIKDLKTIITTEMKGMKGQVYDPQICPSDPDLVSFQRRFKDSRTLYIFDLLSGKLEEVTSGEKEEKRDEYEEEHASPAEGVDWQLDWRPVLDSQGKQWYVFVGDGGIDNFDLYLGVVGEDTKIKLTEDGYNKFVDAQPKWSPDGKHIVFVSQRTGNGDIYLIKHVDKIIEERVEPKPPEQLTTNPELDFYPVWNPDPASGIIAYTAVNKEPLTEKRYLTTNLYDLFLEESIPMTAKGAKEYDCTRPSWDPTTGSYLAYFMSEKLMETSRIDMKRGGITQEQSAKIGISKVELDEGMILKYKAIRGESPCIAFDVVPDDYSGPLWLSGSQFIMFVKSKLEQFNPIYVANQRYWAKNLGRFTFRVDQNYKMPVDLSVEKDKIIFSCQEGKEYKIVMGTLSGMDFQLFEHPVYALSRPELHEKWTIGQPVERRTVKTEGPLKWLMKPIVGDNPLIFLNRRITPIVVGVGVGLYLILKPEEAPPPPPPNPWIPPDWPQTKKIYLEISFGG
ncbi:MAG: TolB family protein [Candidatus Zixiibacteriota bacterium]